MSENTHRTAFLRFFDHPAINRSRKPMYSQDMPADEKRLSEELQREGFHHTYVWQDGPNVFYPEHVHNEETAHVVLNGELTLIMGDQAKTYVAGQRCDVPAGARHAARVGPSGCRYLIGER